MADYSQEMTKNAFQKFLVFDLLYSEKWGFLLGHFVLYINGCVKLLKYLKNI